MKKRKLLIGCFALIAALTLFPTARADIPEAEENPSAQPQSELLLTNATDIGGLFLEGYNYPVGSWVWTPTTFEPMTIVWADTGDLPSGLAGITNSVPTTVESVNAWPLWVTLWPQSNTVTVLQPWSDASLTEFSVPDGFSSWDVYEENLWPSCILSGINYTNWETLVEEGYTQFSVPQVTAHAWLMDIGSRDTYWNNFDADCEAAEAASVASMSGRFMAMDEDDEDGGDPCSITNLTQPFYVTNITQSVNHATTITWQSCQVFRYLVYSANSLSTNTQWVPQAYVWGQPNVGSTRWTDMATTNDDGSTVTQRFYRVQRLLGSPIAAGENHSLAILTNDTLWAWGDNLSGQLGEGSISSDGTVEFFPVDISATNICEGGISNTVALAAGNEYSVAVDAHGIVWTWGDEANGELGNGTNGSTSSPAPITGVSNIVSVATGGLSTPHTLALRADGTVWAWGSDRVGQLGVGGLTGYTSTNSPIQSLVPDKTVIVAVAAGDSHSMALDTGGNVWTWGYNGSGQLGNGEDVNCTGSVFVAFPTMLTTISNVIAIAAGYDHTIAVTADKTVWTWGGDDSGQLGRTISNPCMDDSSDPSPGQVPPSLLSNVVAITGGYYYSLAVTSNGQVYAWGDNYIGVLGTDALTVTSTDSPMRVFGITNTVLVSASPNGGHVMAMTVDQGTNHYWGWGDNDEGQVGTTNGNVTDDGVYAPSPEIVQFCSQSIQLGTGGVFTANCTGTLLLFFNDNGGEFGDNSGAYTAAVGAVSGIVVEATNSLGVTVGMVYSGSNYTYSATGFCDWAANPFECTATPGNPDCSTDANGAHSNGEVANCVSASWTPGACSAPCPTLQCYSLVGKIVE